MRHRQNKTALNESTYYVYNIDVIIDNLRKYINLNGNMVVCDFKGGYPKLMARILTLSLKTYHNWENQGVIDIFAAFGYDKTLDVWYFDAQIILNQLETHRNKQLSGKITRLNK